MTPLKGLDTPIFFLFTLWAQRLISVWRFDPLILLQSVRRFTNTIVKTAIRILNTWSLEARNRIAQHAKVKRYPN
jgi:hypothetical protein